MGVNYQLIGVNYQLMGVNYQLWDVVVSTESDSALFNTTPSRCKTSWKTQKSQTPRIISLKAVHETIPLTIYFSLYFSI